MLRAILKAADLCVADPAMVARYLVDRKFTASYDYALQALGEVPYRKWRDYDAGGYGALLRPRLHEAGMIKSSPRRLLQTARTGASLDELKRELKM